MSMWEGGIPQPESSTARLMRRAEEAIEAGQAELDRRRIGSPPAGSDAYKINAKKQDFMLQYILNARLSGRGVDVDSSDERWKLVKAAEDLYKRVEECCKPAR